MAVTAVDQVARVVGVEVRVATVEAMVVVAMVEEGTAQGE